MIQTFLLLWLSWQAVSPEALQHLQAGSEAVKEHHYHAAIIEFKKVTELEPKLAAGFINLGAAYIEEQDYASATAPLKRALELSPDQVDAHQLLGYALLAQGYAAEAIPHLERAHEEGALGIAQVETGQLPEAVANLQTALAKRPNDPDLLYYLGRASGLLSKQSIDTLQAAYPDSARAHQAMAENYFVLRQMPQAEREFRAALQLRPNTPHLHLGLGIVYAAASQWGKAEEQFRAETKLQPGSAEAAYRLGNTLLQEGKVREARVELERADRLKPEMPETLYALGKTASMQGDSAAAEKSWTKVVAVEKESDLAAKAHFALAGLYRKQGKTAEAEREMQEFEKLQNVGERTEGPNQ
jgi:tetratricopeptide (TPR) repeat protein